MTCATALEDFRSILSTVGGENECDRAEHLLRRVTIVPDVVSPRVDVLPISAKIKERAKVTYTEIDMVLPYNIESHCVGVFNFQVIFGTADSLQAVVVTANSGFVRAAEQRNVSVAALLHESRALTERKQVRARPIKDGAALAPSTTAESTSA